MGARMLTVPGYSLHECVHEGALSSVYRATRLSDNHPVVIKVSTQKILTGKKIQSFQREFELGHKVNSIYVVRYLDLHQYTAAYGMKMALVMEDDNAVELTSITPPQGLPNDEFLEIAIQIVQGLQAIHTANVIHNDLKFSNILIQPKARTVKIIDFNLASSLLQQGQSTVPNMGGTLAYISPEQTGRINRNVDYRTDFYSLGVVFYQLLCGRLPFTAQDDIGLIHQHLATQAKPLHQRKPSIALTLSLIVMKLLEKEADNRYQSCEGILYDLRHCQSALQEKGPIPEFQLGQQDFSNKLTLSQYLYGRESEIETLLGAFKRVSEGSREGLMVAGQAGVGKTMFIQEIQKSIALKGGYFIYGKFDQLNKNIAYSAITQAFDGLIMQLLTEEAGSVNEWKTRLLAAVGTQAQFISKVIPSLSLLIGEQPMTVNIDISQAKNVLNLAFQAIVNVFADVAHPLVFFLDDLQWADNASLDLMVYLMRQSSVSHLLWIGAYRDTEVNALHPAIQAITTLQEAQVSVQTIALAPLKSEDIQCWLSDSLRKPLAEIRPLSELIFQKTAGNPFFVKLFLHSLYNQHLLTFSQKTHWQWDLDLIHQHPATENVIAFMTYRIQQLPVATQRVLSIASCLGHKLAMHTVQIAVAGSEEAFFDALQPALNRGILIQNDGAIHFVHDRVQEAAYCLLAEADRATMHQMIGERLRAQFLTDEAYLFDIVAQFNRCGSLIKKPQERLQLAGLNLKAAQKAKQATAYLTALEYLHVIPKWVDTQKLWQSDYPLAFNYHKELAEVEYLSGHVDISQAIINDIQPYLQSALDKVNIYRLLIIQKSLEGDNQEAVDLGHQALQLLGGGLPLESPTGFIAEMFVKIQKQLANRELFSLLDAPLVADLEKQAIFQILDVLYGPSYLIGAKQMYAAIAMMGIDLSLTYGHAPESCLIYTAYGLTLCGMYEEYALGYQFGNLALQLAEKLQSRIQYGKSSFVMFGYIYHWSKTIQELPALLTASYDACLAYGTPEYAGYCAMVKVATLYHLGIPLAKVQQEATPMLQFAENTKNQIAIHAIQATQLVLANLMGNTRDERKFDSSVSNEAKFIEDCKKINSFYGLYQYYTFKAQALYLYGHFEEALEQLILVKENLTFIESNYTLALVNWYESLSCLACYQTVSPEIQKIYRQQIDKNQQQMAKWQASCPENFAHKYVLVAAELARVNGDHEVAETNYNQAVILAERHGFVQEQALAAELAVKYWLERNNPLCAQGYLSIAFKGYKKWGAERKFTQFKARYSDLLNAFAPTGLSPLVLGQETTLSANTLKSLDLSSILKASQVISRQTKLSELLSCMMQIVVENTGAQKGAMLLVEADDTIFVQAEYVSNGTITTLQKIPLIEWFNGSHAVVQYVKTQRQSVRLDNAITHEKFKNDPYIRQTQAKSILCVPLLKDTQLKAILYVENDLMSYAFTPERVKTVQILTAQMAISLENARYFSEQLDLITQLKDLEQQRLNVLRKLAKKERQKELALKVAQLGIWSLNLKEHTVTIDTRLLEYYGVSSENIRFTLEQFIAMAHPDDRARIEQAINRTITEGMIFDIEFRVIKPLDRSVHIMSSRAEVVCDGQGQPEYMIGVSGDVTQQKRLEEERFGTDLLKASQVIRAETLFDQFTTSGESWETMKSAMTEGGEASSSQTQEVALEQMKWLVEYRDLLDYIIYRRAAEIIFPSSHYEIIKETAEENIEATSEGRYQFKSSGYTLVVYFRADATSVSRPRCEIKIEAPGSRTLTSDIDTSIDVTGAQLLDLSFAHQSVKDKGPDYNLRVRNQMIKQFYCISEECHHITSSASRDSNAYANRITEHETEEGHLKFNLTGDNNPIINGTAIIQDSQFYARHKLVKHRQEQAASVIPLRQAMDKEEWELLKKAILAQLKNTMNLIDTSDRGSRYWDSVQADIQQIMALAETLRYEAEKLLHDKIEKIKREEAGYWASSPLGKSPERLVADMRISAMNQLYGEYLDKEADIYSEVNNLKQKTQDLIVHLETLYQRTSEVPHQKIEEMEQQLRNYLTQAADKRLERQRLEIITNLFAHQAYVGYSAIDHVVKGMFGKEKFTLSKQTVMGSALQQIGFRMQLADYLRRNHKTESEIAYYCAKYGQRVFDLLFNDGTHKREVSLSEEQIDMLTHGEASHTLEILPHLKAMRLQPVLRDLFTPAEYHLINSEVQITQVKKESTVTTPDTLQETMVLLRKRMHTIDKESYPDQNKITEESMQAFARTSERELFKSLAAKLIAAVYIAKFNDQGHLWGSGESYKD